MASPFSLAAQERSSSTTPEQYKQLLAREMARYGDDRDRAVRSANIAAGFGNSTAERFMHQGGGAAAPAVPTPRPDQGTTGSTGNVPIPQPRPTQFSPDLAVSPQRPPDLNWQGATGGGAIAGTAVPQNAVPMNSALSLASILRSIPPELLGRLAGRGPGQPSPAIGLGMQPTNAPPLPAVRWE